MSARMAARVRHAAGSGRRNCHAENLGPCAGCHLCGCNRRVFRDRVDANASVGVVVSSRLGLASRMALWPATLLLGSTRLRCSTTCRCRSASGRLRAASRCCRSGVDPAALEWCLLGPRTLGMMHHLSRLQRTRSRLHLFLTMAPALTLLPPARCDFVRGGRAAGAHVHGTSSR